MSSYYNRYKGFLRWLETLSESCCVRIIPTNVACYMQYDVANFNSNPAPPLLSLLPTVWNLLDQNNESWFNTQNRVNIQCDGSVELEYVIYFSTEALVMNGEERAVQVNNFHITSRWRPNFLPTCSQIATFTFHIVIVEYSNWFKVEFFQSFQLDIIRNKKDFLRIFRKLCIHKYEREEFTWERLWLFWSIIFVRSFDVRNRRQFSNARLWSSPTALGPRAFFITATNPAHLSIDQLEVKDEGVYRCRVDFKNAPTRNQKMNLSVIREYPRSFELQKQCRSI